MAHTYIHCLVHCIFSTKDRTKTITPALQEKLWPYIGGISRQRGVKALAVGGIEDHVHILLSIPATVSISKVMQEIKAVSSKWIHETDPTQRFFSWQEGYGAFSVSISHAKKTIDYINSQKEHHRTRSYMEEYVAFLKKHGISYDEKYLWG